MKMGIYLNVIFLRTGSYPRQISCGKLTIYKVTQGVFFSDFLKEFFLHKNSFSVEFLPLRWFKLEKMSYDSQHNVELLRAPLIIWAPLRAPLNPSVPEFSGVRGVSGIPPMPRNACWFNAHRDIFSESYQIKL